MMESCYDFNAPCFTNLNEENDSIKTLQETHIQHENMVINEGDNGKMDCKEHNTGETESEMEHLVEDTEMDTSNDEMNKSIIHSELTEIEVKTPAKRFAMEVSPCSRQSPRLISLSKEIRRRNADRGFMPPPTKGVRRRSLSVGAKPNFTRVEKKHPIRKHENPLGALTKVDEEILSEMSNYKNKSDTSSSTVNIPLKISELNYMKETISQKAMKRSPKTKPANTAKETSKGVTKVQPFHFSNANKPKEAPVQPFVSLAELNMKYFTKTPQRFRTRSSQFHQAKESDKLDNKLTVPHTPNLTTKSRTRTNHHPSRQEIEEKEIEEVKMYKFKANPLNRKVLKSPNLPTMSKKDPTVPTPFDIIDEKKPGREIGESIICKKLMGSANSLASLPHSGIHVLGKKGPTIVKPFSFETRDNESTKKKQEKIQKELDDRRKLADFHAHPMPVFDSKDQGVAPPNRLPLTKVQPFNMKSETFRISRLQKFEQQVKELENDDKEMRQFHATESISTRREPFLPELPHRMLEDISAFDLNTAKRAEDRENFNIQLKHKEDQLLAQRREREDQEQKDADKEVKQLRKDAVHQAQPVRHYQPVNITLGLLPVTCPKSPNLLTKRNEG